MEAGGVTERAEDLVAVAIAANDAPDLDAGFRTVTAAALQLVAADHTSVIVWDAGLERGRVRAVAGVATAHAGAEIAAGDNPAYRAITTGEPVVVDGERAAGVDGVPAALAGVLTSFAVRMSVPVIRSGSAAITFQAGWCDPLSEAEIATAATVLRTLGALTGLVHRTHE
jgi:hypothetical protein